MKLDVIAMLDKGIENKPAQEWPSFNGSVLDRTKFVTASEVGYCERKVKLDKQKLIDSGYEPSVGTYMPEDWGMLERGHNVERWAIEHLRSGTHIPLEFTGDQQVSFHDGHQAGTPDGVFLFKDSCTILEIKSVDPRTNFDNLPKKVHVDQVIQNCDLVSHFLKKSPNGGVLLYIDASNYKRRKAIEVPYSQDHADDLQDRAERIMSNGPEELSPEGMFNDHCKYCAHTAQCSMMNMKQRNEGSDDDKLEEAARKIFG